MKDKILLIAEKDRGALGAVRCISDLYVAVNESGIWLKCKGEFAIKNMLLQQLPVQKTFFIDGYNRLFIPNTLTPVAMLEINEWVSIKAFVALEIPIAIMPARLQSTININIVSSMNERNADALLTSLNVWKAYAKQAPLIRLQQLKFAVSENADVFIIGSPLPPIPGKAYWIKNKVALPCGFDLEWTFLTDAIEKKFTTGGELILIAENAEWQKIPDSYFVKATRSAVRFTEIK